MANPLDTWKQHAEFTQAAKGLTGKGVIPEYGMQSGYDFQKKYNLNPKVSSVLASGWQLGQEGVRGLGKYLTGDPGALKDAWGTAKKQSAQNIEGILAAHAGTLTSEQQQIRNEYLEGVGQKPDAPFINPTGKNLFTKHGYEDDEYDFSGIEGQTAFNPAMKKMWDMYRLYNTAKKAKKYGPQVIDKGAQLIKKKITGGGKKIITKKKKTPTPPGEKGGPGYIPPKKKYTPPSHQTGGSGGVHSGMKTTKKKYTPPSHQTGGAGGVHSGMKTTPSRRHTGHGKSGRGRDPDRWKADGGLIKLFKYGGFLG
jgi:hypothetical protein